MRSNSNRLPCQRKPQTQNTKGRDSHTLPYRHSVHSYKRIHPDAIAHTTNQLQSEHSSSARKGQNHTNSKTTTLVLPISYIRFSEKKFLTVLTSTPGIDMSHHLYSNGTHHHGQYNHVNITQTQIILRQARWAQIPTQAPAMVALGAHTRSGAAPAGNNEGEAGAGMGRRNH